MVFHIIVLFFKRASFYGEFGQNCLSKDTFVLFLRATDMTNIKIGPKKLFGGGRNRVDLNFFCFDVSETVLEIIVLCVMSIESEKK